MKQGVYPASITPFDSKGTVDVSTIARLMAWFQSGNCSGVVLAGTNGEGPSLSAVEKRDLVKTAVSLANGMEVVLGVSTPSITEAVWLCKQTYQAGADAVLLMAPGYFREASEEGVAKWVEEVMDQSPIGILVYNFPKRTGWTFSPDMMRRLAKHDKMIGLKDSSGSAENISSYASALTGTGKAMYVGDETLLVSALANGWTGTISGAANLLPSWLSQIVLEWTTDQESAKVKFKLVEPALAAIRACLQPASNKRVLAEMGIIPSDDVRLPLEQVTRDAVENALRRVQDLTAK